MISTESPENEATIRGWAELPTSDRLIVAGILNLYGLDVEMRPLSSPREPNSTDNDAEASAPTSLTTFRLENISSPDDLVVKEHFDEYAGIRPAFRKGMFTRAFHLLLDERGKTNIFADNTYLSRNEFGKTWHEARVPEPIEGISIVRRAEAGLPDYCNAEGAQLDMIRQIYARWAIVAGSIPVAVKARYAGVSTRSLAGKHKAVLDFSSYIEEKIS
jgi:hypothetical protein